MKFATRVAWSAALLVAALASAPALRAELATKAAGGTLEFQVISWADADGNRVLPVVFLWHPELVPEETDYEAIAQCRRRNRLGGPPGSTNKVRFDVSLMPVASGREYRLRHRRRKLGRDGVQKNAAVWRSSRLETVATEGLEEGVLVQFEISALRGGLGFGDTLTCECRVVEADPRVIAAPSDATHAPRP